MDPLRTVGRALPPLVAVPPQVLLDGLTALVGARSRFEVAEAVLPPLLDLPGVRAAAVVERAGGEVVVQGSAGYDCATMGPGARLPLDAGLPVTEAVRTGRTVVRGNGPSWTAAPFRGPSAGALLLSLVGAPPDDLAALEALACAVGRALERVRRTEAELADLAVLTAGATALTDCEPVPDAGLPDGGPAPDGRPAPDRGRVLHVVRRTLPLAGPVGGDVLLSLPDGRGGSWLVVADVCGNGLRAALVGRSVVTALLALAPYSRGPAALLADLDRSLRPAIGPGAFVTALVVHLGGTGAQVASAGHPPPLVLTPSGAWALEVPSGVPLGLETGPTQAYEDVHAVLPLDALLLLHSDGLGDREGARGTEPLVLLQGVPHGEPATVADLVLAAAARVGTATDDVALMVVRPARPG